MLNAFRAGIISHYGFREIAAPRRTPRSARRLLGTWWAVRLRSRCFECIRLRSAFALSVSNGERCWAMSKHKQKPLQRKGFCASNHGTPRWISLVAYAPRDCSTMPVLWPACEPSLNAEVLHPFRAVNFERPSKTGSFKIGSASLCQ